MWKGPLAMAAALALSACGASGDEASAADPAASEAAAVDTAGAEGAATGAADAAQNADPKAADGAPAAAAGGASGLTAYVGKFPFDEVDGVIFENHPAVKAGVAATLTDAAVRKTIAETEGPAAPIEMIDGKVSAWACQAHNCGDHQWMVMVDPASGATDVCYHNAEKLAGQSSWFLAGGKQETRPGNCTVK